MKIITYAVLSCMIWAFPLNAMFNRYRGVNAYKNNDLEVAQSYFDQVVTDDPQAPDVLYNLGKIAYKKGEFEKSQAYFEKSLQAPLILPQLQEQTRYDLGNSFVKMEEWKKALEQFEAVLKQNPDHEYAKKMVEQLKKKIQEEEQKKQQEQEKNKDEKNDQKDQDDKKEDNDQSDEQQNQQGSDQQKDGKDDQKDQSDDQKNGDDNSDQKKNNNSQQDQKKKDEKKSEDKNKEKNQQQDQQQSNNNKEDKQNKKGSNASESSLNDDKQKAVAGKKSDKENLDAESLLLQEIENEDAQMTKFLLQKQLRNETVRNGYKNW